jgi:hypothetical protein
VIDAQGHQVGVITRFEALQMAQTAELDLVEVSPTADPPVCRIMDFGKFLFEQNKKAHAAKRKQKQIQIKEVKLPAGRRQGQGDHEVPRPRNGTSGSRPRTPAAGVGGSGAVCADRAEPADGRAADGDDVRAEEEVGPNVSRTLARHL